MKLGSSGDLRVDCERLRKKPPATNGLTASLRECITLSRSPVTLELESKKKGKTKIEATLTVETMGWHKTHLLTIASRAVLSLLISLISDRRFSMESESPTQTVFPIESAQSTSECHSVSETLMIRDERAV
jgi:hypothetical protein